MPDTVPVAESAERVVHATMNCLRRTATGKPTRHMSDPPPGVPRSDIEMEPRSVPIRDGRGREAEFTFDCHGFALLHAPSRVRNLCDAARIMGGYRREMEALLRAELGATRVVAFDHDIRNAGRTASGRALRELAERFHYAWAPLDTVEA
jgi:hypothetical protein